MTSHTHTGIHMSADELARCEFADETAFRSPIPTQVVSSDEYNPMPQTARQAHVE